MTPDEKKAFEDAMRGVKPLKHRKNKSNPALPQQKKIRIRSIDEDASEEKSFVFSEVDRLIPVDSEESISYVRGDISEKVLRKLRRGQYNVEAVLDLHGRTVAEAREALSAFLLRCQRNHVMTLLIIHGKGHKLSKPVLKNKLNHWLRETSQVLAFCSALPKDGHRGALYVLLRRN